MSDWRTALERDLDFSPSHTFWHELSPDLRENEGIRKIALARTAAVAVAVALNPYGDLMAPEIKGVAEKRGYAKGEVFSAEIFEQPLEDVEGWMIVTKSYADNEWFYVLFLDLVCELYQKKEGCNNEI